MTQTIADRRMDERVIPTHTEPATIAKLEGFFEIEDILVKNISKSGVCLSFSVNPNALYLKETLSLELDLGPAGLLKLSAAPRHIFQSSEGRYDLGLAFYQMTPTDALAIARYIEARHRSDKKYS